MFRNRLVALVVVLAVLAQLVVACGGEDSPGPTLSGIQTATSTVTPPFAAAAAMTATPTLDLAVSYVPPTSSSTAVPPTPIVAPTPLVPKETLLTADDLGISTWGDTQISWSPTGNQFLLQAANPNDPLSFYFLIRPPSSVVASYKLSRSVFGTFAWSPDNRYLSFIQQDADGNAGPVKLIDTQGAAYQPIELFKGPCTSAVWLTGAKLLATCGNVIYSLTVDPTNKTAPENIFKLDEQGRLPGSPVALTLIARAMPSPDGKTLAVFGLQTALAGKVPVGEIGFLDLQSKKFSVLDRNDRPVAPVDWTPDSKNLILRNLTADWTVSYTFDFYLASLDKLKVTTNLTKSNPKCDPILGKPECQGVQASIFQTSRIVFAPDGNRYFVTGLRYVPRANVGLQTAERILSGTLSDGKLTQVVEQAAGGKIVGLTWLPNGHYFYSYVLDTGGAKAFYDNKAVTLGPAQSFPTPTPTVAPSPSPSPTVLATTTAAPTPEPPAPTTKAGVDGSVFALGVPALQTVTTTAASTTTVAALTPTPSPNTGIEPVRSPSPAASVSPTENPTAILPTLTPLPTQKPQPLPTPAPRVSKEKPLIYGFYASPTGNWIASVERVSDDKVVQFQLRMLPFNQK